MIIRDKNKRLSLDSPRFDVARHDLDEALQETVDAMYRKEICSATVTLKIDIELIKAMCSDLDAPMGVRDAYPIQIKYKVARALTSRDETKGFLTTGSQELVQDDNAEYFIISRDEASGQLNMFREEGTKAEAFDYAIQDEEDRVK